MVWAPGRGERTATSDMLRLVGLLVPRIVGFRLKHQYSTRVNLCSGSWRRETVVLHENEAITGHGGPHMHELRMSCTRDPRSRSRRLGSESWKDLPPRLLHLMLCISQIGYAYRYSMNMGTRNNSTHAPESRH